MLCVYACTHVCKRVGERRRRGERREKRGREREENMRARARARAYLSMWHLEDSLVSVGPHPPPCLRRALLFPACPCLLFPQHPTVFLSHHRNAEVPDTPSCLAFTCMGSRHLNSVLMLTRQAFTHSAISLASKTAFNCVRLLILCSKHRELCMSSVY